LVGWIFVGIVPSSPSTETRGKAEQNTLDLPDNELGPGDARCVFQCLERLTALTLLDLSGNGLGDGPKRFDRTITLGPKTVRGVSLDCASRRFRRRRRR
jgi:hypothetical protein